MGCVNSKLCSGEDDPVQICKDRKRFIKQAMEHRTSFASAHTAYIHSLRNVSDALREYIQESELEVASGTRVDYVNQSGMDDEIRRVREEEGIPGLEEDDDHHNMKATEDCNEGNMDQEDELEHVNEEYTYSGFEAENERDMDCIRTQEIRSNEVRTSDAKGGETHGNTVYLNRRPKSMGEVIKDLEDQFTTISTSAIEVSGLLEATKVQDSSNKLYVWEKKLYDEVKAGERVRIAYEKKHMAVRNHDVEGDEFSSVDKTRDTVRDRHTQLKVSIESIESIYQRIETLRDLELLPQILELLQGLARMWKVMAECHQIQKRTLVEARLLLAVSKPHKKRREINTERLALARTALNLVAQLLNWSACLQTWLTSQRSYVLSLTGWLLRCLGCDPDPEKVTLSTYPHLIFDVCIGWSRLLKGLNEKHVVDKLDCFASCMGSLFSQKPKEEPYIGTTESMELVEADKVEMLAEIVVNVVCHGMSLSVSSLAEFAISSADEHLKLVNHTSEQHVKVDNVEDKKEEPSDRV